MCPSAVGGCRIRSRPRGGLLGNVCGSTGLCRTQKDTGLASIDAEEDIFFATAGAAPRYLYTHLTPSALCVFHPADGQLLTYLEEDGKKIEPDHFVPTVPMILLNGASGIGTGFSTYVPNYAATDVIANIRAMLQGREPAPMSPSWAGFKGTVEDLGGGDYLVRGTYEKLGDTTVRITELPIGTSIDAYKSFLEGGKVRSIRNNCTDRAVDFTVELVDAAQLPDIEKELCLTRKISTGNMHLFDSKGHIKKYGSVTAILQDFFEVRCALYERRLEHLVRAKEEEMAICAHRARFITGVLDGSIRLLRAKAADVRADMKANGIPEQLHQRFLALPLASVCEEDVKRLLAAKECLARELDTLRRKDGAQLWEEDLVDLERVMNLGGGEA